MALGYSFQPGSRDLQMDQGTEGGSTPKGMSPQQAVKILSLRVPDRPSPTAIAPLGLLQSPGARGAGAPSGGGGLDELIRQLMEMFGGNMDLMQKMSGNMPSPRVIPGGQKTEPGSDYASAPSQGIPPQDFPMPGPFEEMPQPGIPTPPTDSSPNGRPGDWRDWLSNEAALPVKPLF